MKRGRPLTRYVLRRITTCDLLGELERRGWIRDRLAAAHEPTIMVEPHADAKLRAAVLAATPTTRKPLPS